MKCMRRGCKNSTEGQRKLCAVHVKELPKWREKKVKSSNKAHLMSPATTLAIALQEVIRTLVRQELRRILDETQ